MWKSLIVVLFSFLLFSTSQVLAHSEVVVIKMAVNGFEPQQITVDTNSTIIFINEDTDLRWPASNNHPTHELYPEFDPKKAIAVKESWTFQPEKSGTWKYHDHIKPHLRGTIIVKKEVVQKTVDSASTEKPKKAIHFDLKGLLSGISDLLYKIQAFLDTAKWKVKDNSKISEDLFSFQNLDDGKQIEALQKLAKTKGGLSAWEFVRKQFNGQSGTAGNIHDLAHLAGSLIYDDSGIDGLNICSSDFAFGCFHGFLDKAFEKSLADLEKAEEACLKLGNGGPSASCIHGIGHGVASFYQTTDIIKSLTSCQRLSDTNRQYCFDGVFMEFERAASQNFYSKDDPYKPCNSLEQEFGPIYSFACGRNQPNVLMGRFQFSFDDVIKVCLGGPIEFKTACIDTLGFTIARNGSPDEIITGCGKINDEEFTASCARAAAGELVFQNVSGWKENAPKICQSLTAEYQTKCQAYIDDIAKQYGR